MDEKLLSVYIPTYNRAQYIKRQLQFLLSEMEEADWKDIEIIVNDNCSTDNTQAIVEEIIANTPIKYHKNARNLGIVGNAYKASEMTAGKYIWVIGDDDIINPHTIPYIVETLKKYPEISLLHLNYADVDSKKDLVYRGSLIKTSEGFSVIKDLGYEGMAMLMLTTANICLKKCYDLGVQVLNMVKSESYGLSMFISMACLKHGDVYITDTAYIYNNTANMSWKNIEYESMTGVMRVFVKLKNAGYDRKEIKEIYKTWTNSRLIGEILAKFAYEKQWRVFINDFSFSFIHAPMNWIKRILYLITHDLQKLRKGIVNNKN